MAVESTAERFAANNFRPQPSEPDPVSYTHLDVYKRQLLNNAEWNPSNWTHIVSSPDGINGECVRRKFLGYYNNCKYNKNQQKLWI